MIDESKREDWLFRLVMDNLFCENVDTYHNIYKKNKIDDVENIVNLLKTLIQVADVMKDIVNLLDDSYMISKSISTIVFEKLRILIYKYKGF